MRPKIKNYKTINPEQWYTLADISRLGQKGLFPVRDRRHLKQLLELKKLKGIDVGTKNRREFRILGAALFEFMSGNNLKKK